jgi:hypothetical protein
MVKAAWAESANAFDAYMHAVASSAPELYHHVYEWGPSEEGDGHTGGAGIPGGQLWKHKLLGRGSNRFASFTFQNSRVPIPIPTPESTGVEQDELDKLQTASGKRYIFHAKAMVMEYNLPVHILPRDGGKWLFIPLGPGNETPDGKTFVFQREQSINRPGGPVAGKFSAEWQRWWSTHAQNIFDERVAPRLEKGIETIATPRTLSRQNAGRMMTLKTGKAGVRAFNLRVTDAAARSRQEMQKLRQSALDRRWLTEELDI